MSKNTPEQGFRRFLSANFIQSNVTRFLRTFLWSLFKKKTSIIDKINILYHRSNFIYKKIIMRRRLSKFTFLLHPLDFRRFFGHFRIRQDTSHDRTTTFGHPDHDFDFLVVLLRWNSHRFHRLDIPRRPLRSSAVIILWWFYVSI